MDERKTDCEKQVIKRGPRNNKHCKKRPVRRWREEIVEFPGCCGRNWKRPLYSCEFKIADDVGDDDNNDIV